MIRHVALFKWNDDVIDAHIIATATALSGLPEVITSIVSYRHGRDLELVDTTFDYAVVADFHDVDGYIEYRDHPAHRAFIHGFITQHVQQRVAVQFEYPG